LVSSKNIVEVKPIIETTKPQAKPINNIPNPEVVNPVSDNVFKDIPSDIVYKDSITKLYNA